MRRSTRLSTALAASQPAKTAKPTGEAPGKPSLSKQAAKSAPPIKAFPSPSAFETYISAATTPTVGIWLICSKRANPVQTVTYEQALDIALCHGWIDGQRKTHDGLNFIQRFTPRRKGSIWSKRNVEKVAALMAQGRMRDGGLREVELAKADGRWERAYGGSDMEVPSDLERELGKDGMKKLDGLDRAKRYGYLFKVVTAKSEESRKKWIGVVVDEIRAL